MPVLKRCKFVRDVEEMLKRRGYVRAGYLPGAPLHWRRSSAWEHRKLHLRIEIREAHEIRAYFKNGKQKSFVARDLVEALEIIVARELDAPSGE